MLVSVLKPQQLTISLSRARRREELRKRFVKAETTLFRVRYLEATHSECTEFHKFMDFDWILASTSSRARRYLFASNVRFIGG